VRDGEPHRGIAGRTIEAWCRYLHAPSKHSKITIRNKDITLHHLKHGAGWCSMVQPLLSENDSQQPAPSYDGEPHCNMVQLSTGIDLKIVLALPIKRWYK
jgi:hypothetical protein